MSSTQQMTREEMAARLDAGMREVSGDWKEEFWIEDDGIAECDRCGSPGVHPRVSLEYPGKDLPLLDYYGLAESYPTIVASDEQLCRSCLDAVVEEVWQEDQRLEAWGRERGEEKTDYWISSLTDWPTVEMNGAGTGFNLSFKLGNTLRLGVVGAEREQIQHLRDACNRALGM